MTDSRRRRFPALRCRMGDWIYYSTFFRFADVAAWIKPTKEVHPNPRLSERIQRQLNKRHAKDIATYLSSEPERFFNALVIGVYGGEPQFGPMNVTVDRDTGWAPLSEAEEDELEASVGLLQLEGTERLFAIDGQHRVAGIKKAVLENPDLMEDEIAVIFVGHEDSPAGLRRTRRLFTTLNKSAKRVSTADIVLLDEDNSFAITVRRIVNEFEPFKEGRLVRFEGNGSAIPASNKSDLTSIIAIYEVAQDLYGSKPIAPFKETRRTLLNGRQNEAVLETLFELCVAYWRGVAETFPLIGQTFAGAVSAGELRKLTVNHLLARPVGQRVLASAAHVLMSRGVPLAKALAGFEKVPTNLGDEAWHYLLWDPVHGKMLTTAKNRSLAETFVLVSSGNEPRSHAHATKYEEFIQNRSL